MTFLKNKFFISFLMTMVLLGACGNKQKNMINLYSTRHYTIDEELYKEFTEQTGIKVNVIKADPDALLQRIKQEQNNPQADLFFTADYPRLYRAKDRGLLEPVKTDTLLAQTSEKYRDKDNFWYAMSYRLRIIAIDTNWNKAIPNTYMDLTNSIYHKQILVRSGSSAYNISLIASLLAKWGEDKTREFLEGLVANFARTPEGNDRKQVADIYAKKGSLAILNSYYMGHMFNSVDPEVANAARSVNIIYPENTHFNISGFGLIKNAKNRENAIKLLEFITSSYAQQRITDENYEYPVNPNVKPTEVFLNWADNPKIDNQKLEDWGAYYEQAVKLMDEVGWK